jgi:hypothetical protein
LIDGSALQRANEARANVIAEARVYAESVHAPQSLRDALKTYDAAKREALR